MANVVVKINQSEIRRILDRSTTELRRWAQDVAVEMRHLQSQLSDARHKS